MAKNEDNPFPPPEYPSIPKRRMGELHLTWKVLREALHLPDDTFLYDIRYDVVSDLIKIYLGTPDMPELAEGEYPSIVEAQFVAHRHVGQEDTTGQGDYVPAEWYTAEFVGWRDTSTVWPVLDAW